ncbi:hypothetical protein EVAR_17549_1 [Eumeta japonica]|uniref:Uncharacterized protein n=1 Tax=Eumeta variegata TaxID=151549 RepID=A0A4C1WR77_EUMVA|nr:hypothetical protein EVAR_17549_1 [Eumeta japonica]
MRGVGVHVNVEKLINFMRTSPSERAEQCMAGQLGVVHTSVKNMQPVPGKTLNLKSLCIMKIVMRACTDEDVCAGIVRGASEQINWDALGPMVISALCLQNPRYDKIPVHLLDSIMNTCEGFIYEIYTFYLEILSQQPLAHIVSKSKLYELLRCIKLKQDGTIDESDSLISVLKCGFRMSLKTIPFLAKYWVNLKELKETLKTYCSEYELMKAGLFSENDVLQLDWPTWYVERGIKNYDTSKFWPDDLSLSLLRHAFLIKAGSQTLEYFYNAIEESQRQTELERIFKVLMYEQEIRWKELAFILQKLEPDRLDELALSHEYSNPLYKFLFLSWRYRRIGAELFQRLAPRMCPAHAIIVLYGLLEHLLYFKRRYFLGHYSDLRSIFIQIWKNSPDSFKMFLMESGVWMRNFLCKLCELEDENILMCVVDTDYGSKYKRVEICLFIVLVMLHLGKTYYIDDYVLIIAENTPETYDGRNLLSYDSLSDFILREIEIGDVSLLLLMPEYLMDLRVLKWNIVTDRQLMLKIFIKHFENVNNHKLTMFLQWLLNSQNTLYLCIQVMTARRNWHQSIYSNLMANLNFDAAVSFFELLRVSPSRRLAAKNCLRQNMVLLYIIVTFLLKKQIIRKVEWSQTNNLLDVLFDSHLDKQQFIQEFLLSEEGTELLMGVVTVNACYEQYLFLKYEAYKMFKAFKNLKRFWIEPYLQPTQIVVKMQNYGHPNLKSGLPLLMERCCVPPARHHYDLRKIIDANYRVFLAVLSADLEDSRILRLMDARRTVTEVSLDVARLARIHVDVVF